MLMRRRGRVGVGLEAGVVVVGRRRDDGRITVEEREKKVMARQCTVTYRRREHRYPDLL